MLFLIEIPLFHVLNARITFENVNGCRTAEKTTSQMGGGAQCDSGKEWRDPVIASSYISGSGMHRREEGSLQRVEHSQVRRSCSS